MLAAKPDNLNSASGTHMVKVVIWSSDKCHTCTQIFKRTDVCSLKQNNTKKISIFSTQGWNTNLWRIPLKIKEVWTNSTRKIDMSMKSRGGLPIK